MRSHGLCSQVRFQSRSRFDGAAQQIAEIGGNALVCGRV